MSEWISVKDRLPSLVETSLYAVPFLVFREGERYASYAYFCSQWDYPWSPTLGGNIGYP